MTQVEKSELVDDTDGTPAAETVRFMLDGNEYEIDLSAQHAGELRGLVGPYAAAARRQPRPQAARRGRPAELPEISDYARARGHREEERGRVPGRIVEEYAALKRLRAG